MNVTSPFSTPEPLSAAEIDRRLERAVREHERSEKLICIYLNQIKRRRLFTAFGFESVYDYALERFGFCRSKTRALLYLGRRLSQLPALTEALAKGRLGWTKAAKVASVATPETDTEWTEKAVAASFRDLERTIRDGVPAHGGRVSFYLTAEQASVWNQALELCRKVCGEQIDPGLALEYVAGEFLATYQAPMEAVEAAEDDAEAESFEGASHGDGEEHAAKALSKGVTAEGSEDAAVEASIEPAREVELCPGEGPELPQVAARPYADVHREVLVRDGYRCQYPGCSVRAGLHVHHVAFRSRFGRKREGEMNAPDNLVTVCWFHHRMVHAEVIGVSGKAPAELTWRRPELMETAVERHDALADFEVEAEVTPFRSVQEDAVVHPPVDSPASLPNVWQEAEVPNVWQKEAAADPSLVPPGDEMP